MTTPEMRRRGTSFARYGALIVTALFLSGPAPGDVGGCGGSNADTPVAGDGSEAEYDFFDEGLCASFCWRVRECGLLCDVIRRGGAQCDPQGEASFRQCVRGEIRSDIFPAGANLTRCPHSCGNFGGRSFRGAFRQDVAACTHQVLASSCSATTLTDLLLQPPAACTVVCQ